MYNKYYFLIHVLIIKIYLCLNTQYRRVRDIQINEYIKCDPNGMFWYNVHVIFHHMVEVIVNALFLVEYPQYKLSKQPTPSTCILVWNMRKIVVSKIISDISRCK